MAVDVVFLPQGSAEALHMLREDGGLEFRFEEWEEGALILTRRALSTGISPVEVFLCLRGDHLVSLYDYTYIEQLLGAAWGNAWGAQLYIAVDRSIGISPDHIEAHASLSLWYEATLRGRITDIIEVPINRYGYDLVDPRVLRIAADSSRQRQGILQILQPYGTWRCYLRSESRLLSSFLDPFVEYATAAFQGGNLVAIVEKSDPADQVRFAQKALSINPQGRTIIAIQTVLPSAELTTFCQEHSLKWFRCRGPFELRYYIQRLNAFRQKSGGSGGHVEIVPLDDEPVFIPFANAGAQNLLLTSSFNPATEPEQCIEAAHDAGKAIYEMPLGTNIYVHQAINYTDLAPVLRSIQHPTVWLHLGHGKADLGIQETSGVFRTPDEWLSCFTGYDGGLGLVFFAGCQSVNIARRFAAAGVGVAIGFEEDVPPEACRILAARIVRTALSTSGNREEILKAFHSGCADLIATGYGKLGPTAFYAVAH